MFSCCVNNERELDMKTNMKRLGWLFFCFLLSLPQTGFCEVRLPALISDGMVLQRETKVKIWGWAEKGEKVRIDFNGKIFTTCTGPGGKWVIVLSELKAGGPFSMTIKADNHITLKDIMIGDVWVCSGQSNMELNMQRVSPLYGAEIATSENPYIRYFEVPDKYNFNNPQNDLPSGQWKKANPENVLRFSAVSYFFGKEPLSQAGCYQSWPAWV